MASVKDDRGYNQGFVEKKSTIVRLERRCDWIVKEMSLNNSTEILEIGCGTGRLSYMLADKTKASVTGSDICVPFIEEANLNYKLNNLKYMFLDFNNPAVLEGKKFDYIVGNGILHHLYYGIDHALINIKYLLKAGGKMIFMEPNIYNPYCALIFQVPFFREKAHLEPDEMAFSDKFIIDKLNQAGFSTSRVSFKDFLLPGIPEVLVEPSIAIGNIAESVPFVNKIAQSLFIVATNNI